MIPVMILVYAAIWFWGYAVTGEEVGLWGVHIEITILETECGLLQIRKEVELLQVAAELISWRST